VALDRVILPVGLAYRSAFVPPADGDALIAAIDARPWLADLRRRVQHYGYRYDYQARRVDADSYLGPLPAFLDELAARMPGVGFERLPDQAIVNEYLPGQGISAHIDCVPCFGPTIATLSLGSACEIEFRHPSSDAVVTQALEVGSLLTLAGEARYDWTHAIRARKSDRGVVRGRRLSVTFRTVLPHTERRAISTRSRSTQSR
jgi:alkylated DNA repair dioxygenase AlkB